MTVVATLSGEAQVHSNGRELELFKVLENASIDETASDAVDIRNCSAITLFVETSAGVSAGVVKLETAVNLAGPWFVAGSVSPAAGETGYSDSPGNAAAGLPAKYARARIETVISGGTINAYICTQK